MASVARTIKDLVIANRILADQGVVDAFGEVSARHPSEHNRFLLARPMSPAAVEPADIIEFAADGSPGRPTAEPLSGARFIHAAVYEARADVMALLHAGPEDILPFGIANAPLRPVIGSAGDMGGEVPVWDIAECSGDGTALTVETMEQGRDLARCLGRARLALLRAEGLIVTGRTLNDVVRLSVYVPRNARTILAAAQLGAFRTLSAREAAARLAMDPESNAMRRGWEYWARKAGCGDFLSD
ncbi:MAG TPA: class II aldolase/adducin family protein [Xanthobacteraceae bacterium]|jgi:HCOMODA/2-hydroxy-3-carboxy-muconic semialdehyde decarboxylase